MDHLPQLSSSQRVSDRERWVRGADRRAAEVVAQAGSLIPAPCPPPAASERRASLARTIEVEIIPRLLRAHCAAPPQRIVATAQGMAAAAVADFAQRVRMQDTAGALSCLGELCAQGASINWLGTEVLVPAVQRLAALWQDDLGDFEHVSRALWRLQQVAAAGPLFAADPSATGWRALLVPGAGESHTLGSGTVAEALRRAGWNVWAGPASPVDELCSLIADTRFDLVVLSVSCHSRVDLHADAIRAVRRAAHGRDLAVLVAGPQHLENPAR